MNIDHIKPGQFIEVTKAELDAINRKTLDDYERLVAAAPELLAALTSLLGWADAMHCTTEAMNGDAVEYETFPEARAAIAKAGGGV